MLLEAPSAIDIVQVYAEQKTAQSHHEVLDRGRKRFEIQFLRMIRNIEGLESLPDDEKIARLKEVFEKYGPRGIYSASIGLLPTELIRHPEIISPSRLLTTIVERLLTPQEIGKLNGTVRCSESWERIMPVDANKLLLADLQVCGGICILSNPRDRLVGHNGQLYRADQKISTFYDFGLPEEEITEHEGTIGFEPASVTRRVIIDNKGISHCVAKEEVLIHVGRKTLTLSGPAPVFIEGCQAYENDFSDLMTIINRAKMI